VTGESKPGDVTGSLGAAGWFRDGRRATSSTTGSRPPRSRPRRGSPAQARSRARGTSGPRVGERGLSEPTAEPAKP